LVSGRFNGLVSNPPWLALSKIANNPYHDILTKKADDYAITPTGSSRFHIDLATIFLLHSVDRYLQDGAAVGCITPETVLNGKHHKPFRTQQYSTGKVPVDLSVTKIWRVDETTFKNNAVVLFGRKEKLEDLPDPIPGALVKESGQEPREFNRLARAGKVIWSDTLKPEDLVASSSSRPAEFRQGADIMPRTLYFVEARGEGTKTRIQSIDRLTSPLAFAVKDAKQHTSFKIPPSLVPSRFVFPVLTSNLMTPFDMAPPLPVFLPIEKDVEETWKPVDELAITAESPIAAARFRAINQADTKYETIMDRINFRQKLTQQVIDTEGYLVFTGASGKNVCSTYIPVQTSRLIIDQTLYWAQVGTEDEAIYLSGLFNSEALSSAIREFQPRGLFKERHIHKLPFEVTPLFDPGDPNHQAVVETTKKLMAAYEALKAEDKALQKHLDPNSGVLQSRRRQIAKKLKQLHAYEEYEAACREIFVGAAGEYIG
jgi:hypothetical protein